MNPELILLVADKNMEERAEVVVIDPELEIWVWSASPHVEDVLGWRGSTPPLRSWLRNQGLWGDDRPKPQDPKRAMEGALYEKRIPRSSSLYRQLAEKVGLTTCRDASLKDTCRYLVRRPDEVFLDDTHSPADAKAKRWLQGADEDLPTAYELACTVDTYKRYPSVDAAADWLYRNL
jgi:hypothetical protein